MRILVVEEHPMIGASLMRGLTDEEDAVDWVQDAVQAEAALIARVTLPHSKSADYA